MFLTKFIFLLQTLHMKEEENKRLSQRLVGPSAPSPQMSI